MTRDELLAEYAKGRRDFYRANLREANLYGAYLYGADLYRAYLSGADLSEASLREANLYGADLSGANLYRANLREANLYGAYLSGANLREANLYRANLREANLYGADLSGATLPHFQLCPEVGAFSAFKALEDGVYAELVIPADAPRTSSLVGRKCRAAWVEVAALYRRDGTMLPPETVGYGLHDRTEYRAGATVVADGWNDDIRVECTHGIHFFTTLREAHDYV